MAQKEKSLVEVLRWYPYESKDGSLVGFATIRWGDVAFSGVRLMTNRKTGEHYVQMPSQPDAKGETYYNIVWLAFDRKEDARDGYQMICDCILDYLEHEVPDKPEPRKSAKRR